MTTALELTQQLIACPSVTPDDGGCQQIIADFLRPLGFEIEHLRFHDVDNLWARRGDTAPLFVFVGHTDVVPSGPEQEWQFPPFQPTIHNGYLYGRGAADMKSSIAAMLTAYQKFLTAKPEFAGSIALLLTSDEEGPSINGVAKVIEVLQARNEQIDWALVGEPSSTAQVGDTLKNGRRGSLSGKLTVRGKQGHIAYPQWADNAIHRLMPAITELVNIEWDQGNRFFPATSLQFSNIHAGTGANNVIPGSIETLFNFRYSPEVTAEQLQTRFETVLKQHQLDYSVEWNLSGKPFITQPGTLVSASIEAIKRVCGYQPALSTSGGTSDGRFIAPTGSEVIELGVCNSTIHQIDERVRIADIETLEKIYLETLYRLFKSY